MNARRKPSIFDKPHTLDPADISNFLKTFEQAVASGNRFPPFKDEVKTLYVMIGKFEVRTHVVGVRDTPQVHYSGPDLHEAVRVYNELR